MRGVTTLDRQHADGASTGAGRERIRWTRRARAVSAVIGVVLTGGTAFAATNWLVGLNGGSSGQGQAATASNLTVTAAASPGPVNKLYPGGTGDVVVTIANGNAFPVTITGFTLPSSTTYATGYSDSALTTANGCTSAVSSVAWNYATTTGNHTLTTPLVVAAGGSLVVTLQNDAAMGATSDSSCAGSYLKMPAFSGIAASAGGSTPTASPATDAWTS